MKRKNLKYYNRKIVEDRRKSRLFEPMKSEDDEWKRSTPIGKRPILIKSKTDSYIDVTKAKIIHNLCQSKRNLRSNV